MDHDHVVLVDLAVLSTLSIDGPWASGVLRAVAIELATALTAEDVELILVGFSGGFDAFERTRRVIDLEAACAVARRRIADFRLPPDRRTGASDAGGFSAGLPPEPWPTTIFLCASAASTSGSQATASHLAELAHGSGGVVVAVFEGAVPECRWRARGSGERMELLRSGEGAGSGGNPVGPGAGPVSDEPNETDEVPVLSSMVPHRLGGQAADQIALLVATASRLGGVDRGAPPYDAVERHDGIPSPATGAHPDAGAARRLDVSNPGSMAGPSSVKVRVLGPIEVQGSERPFTRAWSLDLVVYLALHPAGATTDQWSTALWPDRLMAPASLHSTASAARRALGGDASGGDHLPRAHGRLRLAETVTSDWDEFQLAAAGDDPSSWHSALRLVRGRPLDGLRATDWAVLEGILPCIESAVVDVASRLASQYLAEGDADGAQWAARQGLLVSPYDERLYRMLLRAADLAGNPAGVESAMAELVRLVAEDIEPYDAVHPDTLALYRALTRRGDQH